jgi:hypothetical protein
MALWMRPDRLPARTLTVHAVASRVKRWARPASLLGSLAIIGLVHLWIVTGGRWSFETNPSGSLYGKQAAAFRAGQLALLDRPPAELLALPDPYDGRAWLRVMTTPDLSLFGDRFYLYFGPFPALLLALGSFAGLAVPDGMLGLAFDLVMVAVFAVVLTLLRRRVVPSGAWAVDRLLLLTFGLAAPVLFVLARLSVYETAITGGQALLLLGLAFGLAADRQRRWRLLVPAGLSLGLAAATRVSLVPALIAVAVLLALAQPNPRRAAVALVLPFGTVLALLAAYNAARFGSPFETGLQYAITTLPHRAWLPEMFAPANLGVTVPWYGWRPPLLSWEPPFLLPGRMSAAEWVALQGWYVEPWGMTGIVWLAPILPVGLGAAIVASVRRDPRVLFVAGLGLAALLAAAPILLYRALYWRYYLDALPLALLAAATAIHLLIDGRARRQVAVLGMVAVLTVWSGLVGLATGIAARNAWSGFAEADGLIARAARQVPAVAAVAEALHWIGEHAGGPTVALIAEPLPGTPATVDIGTPVHVEVARADPREDPCWMLTPGPGVAYFVAERPIGEPLARFDPLIGPPAVVSRAPALPPPPKDVRPGQTEPLCPVAVDARNLETFGAEFVRRFRSRAFRVSGWARYQTVAPSSAFAVRILAYGIPAEGQAPTLTVALIRWDDGVLVGAVTIPITEDYFYRWYEAPFAVTDGPVDVVVRYDDDGRWRPWWAVSIARVEVASR